MLAVFCKKTAFLGKNSTFTQRNSARTVLEIKGNKNVRFTDYASRIRLRDCSELAKNWKNDNDVAIC